MDISPAVREQILCLVRLGNSYSEVARDLQLPWSTVRSVCVTAGVWSQVKPGHGKTPWRENTALSRRKRT